ncbi:4633_t:CDS:10 [Dentiscutata erythropus]|uniref:4633_t:CDS:1 n=1 Tax=Dentiscutata erythropus TaxID=1348616 RepID=A0A9N9CI18_9GLOM|nr:4633_t:CDS:10 [Dentiscutata erythropus]
MSEKSIKSDDSKGPSKPTLNVFAQPHFRSKSNTTRLPFKDFQKNVPGSNLQSSSDPSPKSIFQTDNNNSSSDTSLFSKIFSTKQNNSEAELVECINEENPTQEIPTNGESVALPELNSICPSQPDEESPIQSGSIHTKDLQSLQTDVDINDCSIESHIIQNSQDVDPSLNDDQNSSSEGLPCLRSQSDLSSKAFSINECVPVNAPTSSSIKPCSQITSKNLKNNSNIDELHVEKEGDDLSIIIEVAHKWKNEVSRKDYLIKELHDEIHGLKKTVEQRDYSLSLYIERMSIVEALIKRQQTYTDHNRERIEKMKTKYYLYRNSLSNMLKRMEEVRDEKSLIESEIGSLKCEFNKLAALHKSISESHASNFQSQQSQIAQITDLNTRLTEANAQLNNVIAQLRQLIQDSDAKSSCCAAELESTREKLQVLLCERDTERITHMNKCKDLESLLKLSEDKNKALTTNQKENEERIAVLTKDIQQIRQELESTQAEMIQLNLAVTDKDQRISSLLISETECERLQQELGQTKINMKNDFDLLQKELEATRAQQIVERQRLETEFHDEHRRLQAQFHKERCQLESEWRNERNQLESEWRNERIQLESECRRLESDYRDERSERFRVENDLRNSERKLEEMRQEIDNSKLKIAQLEFHLSEVEYKHTNRTSVAIGTTDIPDLDLQIQYNKAICKFDKEQSGRETKIEELSKTVETWKSKAESLESHLSLISTKHEELQNEHNKIVEEIINVNRQHNEAIDQALSRAACYYQEMAKRTTVEHENDIRKRDCKIREAEAKELALTEEIKTMKAKLLQSESNEKSLMQQLRLRKGCNVSITGNTSPVSHEHREFESSINEVSYETLLDTKNEEIYTVDSAIKAEPNDELQSELSHDWLSPNAQTRSKRRKASIGRPSNTDGSQYAIRSSAPSTPSSSGTGALKDKKSTQPSTRNNRLKPKQDRRSVPS